MKLEDMKPIVLDFGKDGKLELVPVKHGAWKRLVMEDRWYKTKEAVFQCDKCRHTQKTASNFCGACGARMDGGIDG